MKKYLILLFLFFVLAGCGARDSEVAGEKTDNQTLPQTKELPAEVVVPEVTNEDHIRGNMYAPVTIIIYSDFECLFCASFEGKDGSIEKAKKEFGSSLRFVFRHYPLAFHAQAKPAAEAGECAAEQGKFWEMHDLLFADSAANKLSNEQFKQDAALLGLDEEKFSECLTSGKFYEKVVEAANKAAELGVRGTPNAFVNGRHVIGAIPYEDYETEYGREDGLQTIIKQALSEASGG